jgi:murein L,D-transpeptidase YcbB/YkuD
LAAGLLAISACGVSGDVGEGSTAVQPDQVSTADLQQAVSDPRVRRFYEARQWQPAWNADSAEALVAAIDGAGQHGLDPGLFRADVDRASGPAAREAALTLAALSYAEALARGRVDPNRLFEDYAIPRPQADVAAGLNGALGEDGDLAGWLNGLAPQDDEYRALSQAYVAASREASHAPIPAGATIRPGASDPRIPAISEALRRGGYLAAAEPAPKQQQQQGQPAAPRYTPELQAAVRRFQQDRGLAANGNLGPETLTALNETGRDRARTLAVNLERRRWLPRETTRTRIDVNIVAATLTYWRDGAVADRRPVVTGQPGNETPELLSPLFRLVANPTWTVPRSIEEEEILPKGAAYLARNNMERRDGMIVQRPGPQNALGLVKFDMQNDQAIYLHDTPAKALFSRAQRHFSHGCVRVSDALGFARMLAEQNGVLDDWEEAQAQRDGSGNPDETFVPLPQRIPVRLLYHSAVFDSGRVRFMPDVYGWDEDVAQALGLPARQRPPRAVHQSDLGP